MSGNYDLVIVGGGISGASLLYTTAKFTDIERATGYGGVRPQIVDTSKRSLDMGEAKIVGDDIIFNITPSPGASTCLKNAMRDTRTLLEFLDGEYEFDEAAFREATIENFPRVEGPQADADAPEEVAQPTD